MKVVTFGEIMLRLSSPGFERFVQASRFDVVFGGGEANVAASLAGFGDEAWFVSRVPGHEIGEAAIGYLRHAGVRTDAIVRGGDRLGIYFLETGASQRPSKVIYDRAGSAVATMDPDAVDWDAVLEGAAWFHWTGITPALGPLPLESVRRACLAAKRLGVTVSCDLNFRAKLWTTRDAQAAMVPLMEHVDVCIGNEEDAQKGLGLKTRESDVDSGVLDGDEYLALARRMRDSLGFDVVALSLRESHSATRNGFSAVLCDGRDCPDGVRSRRYDVHVVDRVGAGDAFAGGLIHGLMHLGHRADALEFGVAASVLKHTVPGDFNRVTGDEVNRLVRSGGSGRVER
jgi:2-dehydro-3-deoxygluconokinase